MSRDRTVAMLRVRNEDRWIRANLTRAWQVAQTIVLFDDTSTDDTIQQTIDSFPCDDRHLLDDTGPVLRIARSDTPFGSCDLRIILSPFGQHNIREKERANEIRDRAVLWHYVKSAVDFDYVLCLDGDELLSHAGLRAMPSAWALLATTVDILQIPFVYLWEEDDHIPGPTARAVWRRRVDGLYGLLDDYRFPVLRFPRLFTTRRWDAQRLFQSGFDWQGNGSRGGIHCGPVPMTGFTGLDPAAVVQPFRLPIIHFGYVDAQLRQTKYAFYNRIDPGNEFEGYYAHLIGERNQHAPDPLRFEPYVDD